MWRPPHPGQIDGMTNMLLSVVAGLQPKIVFFFVYTPRTLQCQIIGGIILRTPALLGYQIFVRVAGEAT